MNKELWFPVPVWYDILSDDFSKVTEILFAVQSQNPTVLISNRGGYQSSNLIDLNNPSIDNFLAIISYHCNKAMMSLQPTKPVKLEMDYAWLNINCNNAWNVKHIHPRSTFSCVFYLQVPPDSGDISFFRPDLAEHYIYYELFKDLNLTVKYKPQKNFLLVFPSWVPHEVQPNMSNEPRISVACNFNLRDAI